jgi:SAM-dependent methyltransferase
VTREFCTLFDIHYLPRGLVLYRSLERTGADFRLHVFCMDAKTEEMLRRLELPGMTVVPLQELERHDSQLLGVKGDRTQVEYCWTATPAVCLYVLETNPALAEITYVDADLMFFSDPEVLFDEMGGNATMIVPHRYAPEHLWKEPESGIFNVEWLTFRRDEDGLEALQWWHDRCIEWCYFRVEDGKMGDQKYLDDWPERFRRVHVLANPGGGLAPWNVTNHQLGEKDGRIVVDGFPLVFYHYHSLRLYRRTMAARAATILGHLRPGVPTLRLPWRSNYVVSQTELDLVWEPYLQALDAQLAAIRAVVPRAVRGLETFSAQDLASRLFRGAARRAKVQLLALRRRLHIGVLPGSMTRYRDSWRSRDVARQMVELTDRQLENPEAATPFRSFRELLEQLVGQSSLPPRARFLDIGCGVGGYGELLERWAPGRFAYTGADYSGEIVAAARARWPGREFIQRDLFDQGALDGYDVVFASGLVDVLARYEEALHALCRADAPWVFLHRQQVALRPSVELVSGYSGQRTYRSYVTESQLEALADEHGRRIIARVSVQDDIYSFLLARDESDHSS